MLNYNEKVILPIGVDVDGVRYREVVIDEMTGVDEENLTSKKVKNNSAKGVTLLLQRCIQEITGLVEKKRNRLGLIDEKIVRQMFVADRDFLMLSIKMLSNQERFDSHVSCGSCGHPNEINVDLKELDVYEWEEDAPVEVEIELPRGFYQEKTETYHNKITWAFPTGKTQELLARVAQNQMATSMLTSGIKKVEGMEFTPSTEDVRRLSSRDRNMFAHLIMREQVGVDTHIEFVCESCESEEEGQLSLMGFFSSDTPKTRKGVRNGKSGRKLRKRDS